MYLDPASPPAEVMLQWADRAGNWRRAYWGDDELSGWAENGVPSSMVAMGPLPQASQWVRLEVPAALLDLEFDTVTGLAFTLFGGQAWWTCPARPAAPGLAAANGYPAAAYQALLTASGTSWEELRMARGAAPAARVALAARLGITLTQSQPDQLDQLLLPSLAAVTEAGLQQLFGLPVTTGDPLSGPAATGQLLGWQQQSLYGGWAAHDHATLSPDDYTAPVIDPDIVTAADFGDASTTAGQAALLLWQQRTSWVAAQTSQLAGTAGLGTLLGQQLAGFDLAGTAAAEPPARTSPPRWPRCRSTTPALRGSSRCPRWPALARSPTTSGPTR